MKPTSAPERIDLIDVLRGFAVFGILVANMASYSGMAEVAVSWANPLDSAIFLLTRFLVEAKFYSLFSFLFGWGMAVQMRRAEQRGSAFLPFYLRRLLALLLFGIIHGTLIWTGDILALYALLGCLLLLFRKRSVRFLLASSGVALLLAVILTLPWAPIESFREAYLELVSPLLLNRFGSQFYADGSYLQITRVRVQDFLGALVYSFFPLGNVFAMFLLGLAAGKARTFSHLESRLPQLRRALVPLLSAGVILNGLFVYAILRPGAFPGEYVYTVRVAARTFGAPLLMLGYISAIAVLYQRPAWRRRLEVLAPVGRMALSNYIFQSLVSTLIFYDYGLGLYGRADPTGALVLTLLIYAVQVRLSAWWLERFRFGPLEWFWRLLTYGEPQVLRRRYPFEAPSAPTIRLSVGQRSRLAYMLLSTALLVWGIGLFAWNQSIERERVDPRAFYEAIRPVDTEGVGGGAAGSEPAARSEAPGLRIGPAGAVQRTPGALVAGGDLAALAEAFNQDRAMAQVEALTGRKFAGRLAGSAGGYAAGEYIASQFQAYGLLPAGEQGGYFQSFEIPYSALGDMPRLAVSSPEHPQPAGFRLNRDFSVISKGYAGQGTVEAPVVWVDRCAPEDFISVEPVGAVVFCRQVANIDAVRNAMEFGASGLLLLVDEEVRPFDFGSPRFPPLVPEPIPAMAIGRRVAATLLEGAGLQWQDLVLGSPPQPLSSSALLSVDLQSEEACRAAGCQGRNVLGLLPGRDPRYADEVVILSAHYDHMGSTPDGTIWWGANDDASGVAVMLEIARVWQEQGFVPRRSVLFAAWDAEELGLLGSKAYTAAPAIMAESIYLDLQLDMVGAGGEQLEISGRGRMVPILEGIAQAYALETERNEAGGSDHVSFLQAGIDAVALSWSDPEGRYTDYHRPVDTPERLDRSLFERAGRVAHLGLLSVVEGGPMIQDLLDQRAQALLEGDLPAFLATGDPERTALDEIWYASARQSPLEQVSLDLISLAVQGDRMRGVVQIELIYPVEGETDRTRRVSEGVAVEFRRVNESWRWMGPDLVEVSLQAPADESPSLADDLGVRLFVPPGAEIEGMKAIEPALETLQAASGRLGMQIPGELRVEFYSNTGDIAIFSDPGSGSGLTSWSGPGVLRLVANSGASQVEYLERALVQWLLASNGVQREYADWLWDGLDKAFKAEAEPAAEQPGLVPDLFWSLLEGDNPDPRTAAWAAVEFFHQRSGWGGLGRAIRALGSRCASTDCRTPDGLNAAYSSALGMDMDQFQAAWRSYWSVRLETLADRVQITLDKRAAAVASGSTSQFLATVDSSVRNLLAEQLEYFERLGSSSPGELAWGLEPRVMFSDGRILAGVGRINGEDGASRRPASVWPDVLFTPSGSGFRWADYPFESISTGRVAVLYPPGSEQVAESLLYFLRDARQALAEALDFRSAGSFTLKIYPEANTLRNSIPLDRFAELPAFITSRGGSLKLELESAADVGGIELRSSVIEALTRSMLIEAGLESEWILRGLGSYVAPELDQRARMFAASRYLNRITSAAQRGTLPALNELSPDELLDEENRQLADAQAWDAVRLLIDLNGDEVLGDLLGRLQAGDDFPTAFKVVTGMTEADYSARWLASTMNANLTDWQVSVAADFDQVEAMTHVGELTRGFYHGRAAGTEGASAAAEYIRDQFELLGLQPVVPPDPMDFAADETGDAAGAPLADAGDGEPQAGAGYVQEFQIFRVPFGRAPALQISQVDSPGDFSFRFRYDFLPVPQAYDYTGPVAGELIWIRVDEGYPDVDLTGKIVLRFEPDSPGEEARQAIEREAAGLILVTQDQAIFPFLAKAAAPAGEPASAGIPIFELSQGAYHELIRAAGYTPVSLQTGPALVRLGMQAEMDQPQLPTRPVADANVLGLIPGSDPDLADEVVILSAHYDHVGDDPDAWRCEAGLLPMEETIRLGLCHLERGLRYSGANDDASGIAAMLEIARLWQERGYRPSRSVLFAAWGAQEAGEVGSEYYVENPVFPLMKTFAVIQLDSIGGGRGYYLEVHGTTEHDGLLLALANSIEEQAEARLSLVRESVSGSADPSSRALPWLSYTSTSGGVESDHLTFRTENIPSALLTWRSSSEANEPDGEADLVQPDRLAMAGRMAALLVMSLAH